MLTFRPYHCGQPAISSFQNFSLIYILFLYCHWELSKLKKPCWCKKISLDNLLCTILRVYDKRFMKNWLSVYLQWQCWIFMDSIFWFWDNNIGGCKYAWELRHAPCFFFEDVSWWVFCLIIFKLSLFNHIIALICWWVYYSLICLYDYKYLNVIDLSWNFSFHK